MVVTGTPSRSRRRPPPRKRSRRGRWIALALVVVLAVGAAAVVRVFSGARLVADPSALGRVDLEPFAGSLVGMRAHGADGRAIPLVVSQGRLTPRVQVGPGERISISIVVRRPGWESWALGKTRHETLTVKTPVASVVNPWVTAAPDAGAEVRFDTPVDRVSVAGADV